MAFQIGDKARLYVKGARWVFLGANLESMELLIDVQNNPDKERLKLLTSTGKAVITVQNTRVQILKLDELMIKVRITEENRVYSGKEGWIQKEFLLPITDKTKFQAELPDYDVLERVGNYGDILIVGLDRSIQSDFVEELCFLISAAEDIEEFSIYSTREARKANSSAIFAESHPNALREGLIGTFKKGKFKSYSDF